MLAALVLVACSADVVAVKPDDHLDRRLHEVLDKDLVVALDELIHGDFNAVRVFALDAWTAEGLQEETGQELDMPYYTAPPHGSVLLLVRDGQIRRGITVDVYLPEGSYGPGTRVERDPGEKVLRLVN